MFISDYGVLAYVLAAKYSVPPSFGYLRHTKDSNHIQAIQKSVEVCIQTPVSEQEVKKYLHDILPKKPTSLRDNMLSKESYKIQAIAFFDFRLRSDERVIPHLCHEVIRVMAALNLERGELDHFTKYIRHLEQ